jgi:hypothetical protein
MKRARWLVIAIGLAGAAPACTLGAMGLTSTTIEIHNVIATDQWSYTTPLLVSAAFGLAVDIVFLLYMNRQWSKPMT